MNLIKLKLTFLFLFFLLGLPYRLFNPATNLTSDSWNTISQMSHKQPELIYLSNIENITELKLQLAKIDKAFQNENSSYGLYMDMMDVENKSKNNKNKSSQLKSTLFWSGRSFYYNLIHAYILSGGQDKNALNIYQNAIDSFDKIGVFKTSSSTNEHHYYVNSYFVEDRGQEENNNQMMMEFSGCYLGAMLSLGANAMQNALSSRDSQHIYSNQQKQLEFSRIKRHLLLGKQLTETCHQAGMKSLTGLAPNIFYFKHNQHDPVIDGEGYYGLTAELAESYFILWRLTNDSNYREYAWSMAQAIDKYCKMDHIDQGYSAIINVNQVPTKKNYYQNPQFLSATLKYLYLTLKDDTNAIPLNKWIFNSQGHPLPICGTNSNYPIEKCYLFIDTL